MGMKHHTLGLIISFFRVCGNQQPALLLLALYTETDSHEREGHAHGGVCLGGQVCGVVWSELGRDLLRLMTLPSTYHSPRTVKKKARVLTMGTVKLSSAVCATSVSV